MDIFTSIWNQRSIKEIRSSMMNSYARGRGPPSSKGRHSPATQPLPRCLASRWPCRLVRDTLCCIPNLQDISGCCITRALSSPSGSTGPLTFLPAPSELLRMSRLFLSALNPFHSHHPPFVDVESQHGVWVQIVM
jgi:hypothetical protein